ncbi:methionine adenosyltransferase [Methanofollis formosanus]|uniref:Methionine adenosyltransferase n=1 Tax=Methanofollis formosanus TaxID=299308 RepID=A0A8G1A2Q8_9EURY|nr:methionine adenosyltransferase [Methanofollis formosanus]QYZ80092.1 methionine adenosyltransferase [Methanofollis formosanus]
MIRNIRVEQIEQTPTEQQQIELVERKGIGHPDSIADGIAEAISRALCRAYMDECGVYLHHNTDQGEIVAGESIPCFGGGKVVKPIYALLTGRATKTFDGINIPADAIAVEAARAYVKSIIPIMNMERDIIVDCRMGTGSTDLRDVFKTCGGTRVMRANDTSFGVGHAPFSEAESLVKGVSDYIDTAYRPRHPEIGTDVKVMGLRDGDEITLTLAVAMVDRYLADVGEYVEAVEKLKESLQGIAPQFTGRKTQVFVNTADDINNGSVFLTVNGTSAEMGDDGSVGRGNRCNGLITPNRPMSMEATSGKNPINHIGKIYNLLATQLGNTCVAEVDGIQEIYIRLLSQIGHPIDQPLVASAQIIPRKGVDLAEVQPAVEAIIDTGLDDIAGITEKVVRGDLKTF